jgi:hypothetical protein
MAALSSATALVLASVYWEDALLRPNSLIGYFDLRMESVAKDPQFPAEETS